MADARDDRPDDRPHDTAPEHWDIDRVETREWLEALRQVVAHDGPERARFLVRRLLEEGPELGADGLPRPVHTPYVNSIPPGEEPEYPGDLELEDRLTALLRWNAMAMVTGANRRDATIGGHLATYQSVATLFEVGFHHFWRAARVDDDASDGDAASRGDLVFFQGHASPGIYARAFLEGRLTADQLRDFRRDLVDGGLSSYPHPYLMPDFWQFATVSMGLGPLMAIYQARFLRYLERRGLVRESDRKVWAFLGDGEMDEPESLGALGIASRERLDNLIFVVNCNLQRLDGPVRGNGKVIQELEGHFRGAGWNVIKVLWGSEWDELLEKDPGGLLRQRMAEALDGEYQAYAAKGGAYQREEFFGKYEGLAELVADLSDEEIEELRRGGHDPVKVHAAYARAVRADGPTVILAKTIKGYGLGPAGQGANTTHQLKKLDEEAVKAFHHRWNSPVPDEAVEGLELHCPDPDDPAIRYLKRRREALGGSFPRRVPVAPKLEVPGLDAFSVLLEGTTGDREMSSTMAFVRILSILLRDKSLKDRVVPIVADEARTFGMEGLFRQIGIYAPGGQKYVPVDAEQLLSYREVEDGQVLQEGITEAGGLASWIAAGTSWVNHGVPMIPCFIYYSMFGFQRVADFIWAGADMGARGFLLGATSGRTTLNGEGLQHEDGHSHLIAATVPTCVAYDPTFGYELAVIFQDGLRRMLAEQEDVFYYVTVMNENYPHPAMPEGAEEGIRRGMYRLRDAELKAKDAPLVQLLGSGAILQEVRAAAAMLEEDYGVAADVWSVTSFTELRRDGLAADRWNLLHPEAQPRTAYVADRLAERQGPVVAATDYMKSFADQIRAWVPGRYRVLGTDGFGRSDTRPGLRRFFEVDRHFVVLAALKSLAEEEAIDSAVVAEAMKTFEIDPEKPDPTTV